MKRGLVTLDPAELPDQEWSSRLTQLQQRMAAQGITVALVYGDVYRSDDIAYLTNLCIYWNEGVLAVPATGAPVFLTKLSPRVHPWMRATSKVADLRSGKAFGPLVKSALDEQSSEGVVGLVDAGLWPASVVEDVHAAIPEWAIRHLGGLVREQRLVPSAAELSLLREGARLLDSAVAAAMGAGLPVNERVAVVEREARSAGFTDLMFQSDSTGDGMVTLEITGQYRHGWLHVARPIDVTSAAGPWVVALQAALGAVLDVAVAGTQLPAIEAAAEQHLHTLPGDARWQVTCVNQADLATNGEYDPPAGADDLRRGSVLALGVEVLFPDGGRAYVAETALVNDGAADNLTGRQPLAAESVDQEEPIV